MLDVCLVGSEALLIWGLNRYFLVFFSHLGLYYRHVSGSCRVTSGFQSLIMVLVGESRSCFEHLRICGVANVEFFLHVHVVKLLSQFWVSVSGVNGMIEWETYVGFSSRFVGLRDDITSLSVVEDLLNFLTISGDGRQGFARFAQRWIVLSQFVNLLRERDLVSGSSGRPVDEGRGG